MKLTQFQLTKTIFSLKPKDLGVTGNALHLLLFLSNMVRSDNDYSCYPSHDYLMEHLGIATLKKLKKDIKELEAAGLITIYYGGGSKTNTYYLNVAKIEVLGKEFLSKIKKESPEIVPATNKPKPVPKVNIVQDDDDDWEPPY